MLPPRGVADLAAELAWAVETGAPLHQAFGLPPAVADRLRQGIKLSKALEGFVPVPLRDLVEACPDGASLAGLLRQVESHQLLLARLRRAWRTMWATLAANLVLGALLAWAVYSIFGFADHFRLVFSQVGMRELPLTTEIAFWLSDHAWAVPLGFLALLFTPVVLVWLLGRIPATAHLIYLLPGWGRAVQARNLFALCFALATQLRAGRPMRDALGVAAQSADSPPIRKAALRIRATVEEGLSLYGAMWNERRIPATLAWSVELAEGRGELPEVLERMAGVYARQAEVAAEAVRGFVLPLGVVLLGMMVGLWVAAIFAPIILLQAALSGGPAGSDSELAMVLILGFGLGATLLVVLVAFGLAARRRAAAETIVDHFAFLAAASLPLVPALESLARDHPRMIRKGLLSIWWRVQDGRSLGEAVSISRASLPPLATNAILAGEASGNLAPALGEARRLARRRTEMPRPLAVSMVVYQGTIAILLFALLSMPILDKWGDIRAQMGMDPSDGWVRGVLHYGCAGAVLAGLSLGLLVLAGPRPFRRIYHAIPPLKRAVDAISIRLPWAGAAVRYESVREFCSTLSILLRAGGSTEEALSIASRLDINDRVRRAVERIRRGALEGARLSALVDREPVFPAEVRWFVRTGEASGDLATALRQAAEACEVKGRMASAALARMAVPSAVVANGLLILAFAFAVYGPIAAVLEHVGSKAR
jgi:type II secretory pathway component PulF